MTKKKVHYMLQNVQSVTTFPLPPSKIPDFIGTTENAEKNGRQRKTRKRTEDNGKNGKNGKEQQKALMANGQLSSNNELDELDEFFSNHRLH